MNILSHKKQLFRCGLTLLIFCIASGALADTASPASFFDDAYLRRKIDQELTPGLKVKKIAFTRNKGEFTVC